MKKKIFTSSIRQTFTLMIKQGRGEKKAGETEALPIKMKTSKKITLFNDYYFQSSMLDNLSILQIKKHYKY